MAKGLPALWPWIQTATRSWWTSTCEGLVLSPSSPLGHVGRVSELPVSDPGEPLGELFGEGLVAVEGDAAAADGAAEGQASRQEQDVGA